MHLANEKDTNSLALDTVTSMNSDLSITSDGRVSFERNVISKVRCLMDLRPYPHDVQTCDLKFRSRSFHQTVLNITSATVEMSQMALESSSLDVHTFDAFVKITPSYGRLFSECVFEIKLKRRLEYFLYQVNKCKCNCKKMSLFSNTMLILFNCFFY